MALVAVSGGGSNIDRTVGLPAVTSQKEEESTLVSSTTVNNRDAHICHHRQARTAAMVSEEGAIFQHVESSTLGVVAEGMGGIVREQVFLKAIVTEEAIRIAIVARREAVMFCLDLPEEDENKSFSLCGRCCDPGKKCGWCAPALPTAKLRKAKQWGAELIRTHLFPLLSPLMGLLYSLLLLLSSLTLLGFALPSFISSAKDDNLSALSITRLSLSLLAIVLSSFDIALKICQLHGKCKKIKEEKNYEMDKSEQTLEPEGCWIKIKRFLSKYVLDIGRLLVVEAIVYPTLICNILDNAGGRTYAGTSNEIFKFSRFIYSVLLQIFHVYIVRLLVIGFTIKALEEMRRGKRILSEGNASAKISKGWSMFGSENDSKKRAVCGIVLEVFFMIHIFGQMLTQGLMLVVIWLKVECENPMIASGGHVYISPFTWAMIVLAFLLPIAGTFTFFIPTFVWSQEFPIDFMINILSSLKKCSPTNVKQAAQENAVRIQGIIKSIEDDLKKRKMNICRKIFHPMISPGLVILSCIYDFVLLSFAIFTFLGAQSAEDTTYSSEAIANCILYINKTTPLNPQGELVPALSEPQGWFLYLVITTALVNISNIVVIAIGIWWMVLFPALFPVFVYVAIIPGIIYIVVYYYIYKPCKNRAK